MLIFVTRKHGYEFKINISNGVTEHLHRAVDAHQKRVGGDRIVPT